MGLVAQRPDARRRQRVRHRDRGRLRRLCRRRGHLLLLSSMIKDADGRTTLASSHLFNVGKHLFHVRGRGASRHSPSVPRSTHPPLFQFFCFDLIQSSRGLSPLYASFPLKTTQPHDYRAACLLSKLRTFSFVVMK